MNNTNHNNTMVFSNNNYHSFWCHICKVEFRTSYSLNQEVYCNLCNKTFCEDVSHVESENQHPSNFVIFENNSESSNNNNAFNISNMNTNPPFLAVRPRNSLLSIISSLLGSEDDNLESIIHNIMQNDNNQYGNPPTSQKVLSKLSAYEFDDTQLMKKNKSSCRGDSAEFSCSICKEEYEFKNVLIKLPCGHNFHKDCILPWLKSRNSCPTCRYELETDDKDYEEMKVIRNRSSSANSNISN